MSERRVSLTLPPSGYADWLAELKTRIHSAQQRAALTVNRELVLLYWQIGRDILERQSRKAWGAKVIERLARDLREAFPQMKGFSSRNLKYMSYFAEHCPTQQIGQQPAAQLPWFHIMVAEYALSGIDKPIGVAEYELMRHLPERLATHLPSIEEIEQALAELPDDTNEEGD
jgi:predicted nuclease of restriction endonuclease-like (RecB) superfamily